MKENENYDKHICLSIYLHVYKSILIKTSQRKYVYRKFVKAMLVTST